MPLSLCFYSTAVCVSQATHVQKIEHLRGELISIHPSQPRGGGGAGGDGVVPVEAGERRRVECKRRDMAVHSGGARRWVVPMEWRGEACRVQAADMAAEHVVYLRRVPWRRRCVAVSSEPSEADSAISGG